MTAAGLIELAAAACVAGAAINDIRRFEIADLWSVAIVVLFGGHALLVLPAWWPGHVIAPLLVFTVGLALFSRGWMGGGDVKLLTAIAVWTGLGGLPVFLLGTVMAGGVLALVLIAARRLPVPAGIRLFERDAPLPYAVAIAAGATAWWTVTP